VLTLEQLEREQRAEERAARLLQSCVNQEEWAMYEALGLIRVWAQADSSAPAPARTGSGPTHGYLIYAHKPLVGFLAGSLALVGEFCVAFGGERLPPSDDVLAKWLALRGDERALIASANVDPVGRQIDPARVRRDLERLAGWEAERPR
jgi:hypothetical protein